MVVSTTPMCATMNATNDGIRLPGFDGGADEADERENESEHQKLRLPGLDGGADKADQRENECEHRSTPAYQGLMVVPTKPISARTNANMGLLPISCSTPPKGNAQVTLFSPRLNDVNQQLTQSGTYLSYSLSSQV
jgi:hypothetical protein